MTRTFNVGSHEGYQRRAFEDDPQSVSSSTDRSLRSVARAAKREAEKPPPSMWDKVLGPFYRLPQVAARLQIGEDEVSAMAQRHELVALLTTDNVWAFPSFQFEDPQLQLYLGQAFCELKASEVDDWTAAGWLVARHEELDRMTAKEWLLATGDGQRVVQLAREAAGRFHR